jgi:hypothetical protein
MKKLLITLFITATVATAGMAQRANDPNEDRIEQEKQLRDELKLTHQQTPLYYALNKEYHNKISALQNDASRKEKELSLRKEQEAKLLELLNPEQEAYYKQMMDRQKTEVADKNKNSKQSGS